MGKRDLVRVEGDRKFYWRSVGRIIAKKINKYIGTAGGNEMKSEALCFGQLQIHTHTIKSTSKQTSYLSDMITPGLKLNRNGQSHTTNSCTARVTVWTSTIARTSDWVSSMLFIFSSPSVRPTLIIYPQLNLIEYRYRLQSKHCSYSVIFGV